MLCNKISIPVHSPIMKVYEDIGEFEFVISLQLKAFIWTWNNKPLNLWRVWPALCLFKPHAAFSIHNRLLLNRLHFRAIGSLVTAGKLIIPVLKEMSTFLFTNYENMTFSATNLKCDITSTTSWKERRDIQIFHNTTYPIKVYAIHRSHVIL